MINGVECFGKKIDGCKLLKMKNILYLVGNNQVRKVTLEMSCSSVVLCMTNQISHQEVNQKLVFQICSDENRYRIAEGRSELAI